MLALRALKARGLPLELQEAIFRKIFPTKRQLYADLNKQCPAYSDFKELDKTIVNFVHGDTRLLGLDRLTTREVHWLQLRCKLFRLKEDGGEVDEFDEDYDEMLIISKRKRWAYNAKRQIVSVDVSMERWLTQAFICVRCENELDAFDDPDTPTEPLCNQCQQEVLEEEYLGNDMYPEEYEDLNYQFL